MRLKVLVLSRNYPNHVMPHLGPWVEGLVHHTSGLCEVRVVAPVPYCPPLPSFVGFSRFRQIPPRHWVNGVEVRCPRFLTGPGYSWHSFEADTYYWGIRRQVDRLHREFPFDLIHAHFGYPDGVAAARLARRYGVPLVITEHAPWRPWMEDYPRVRRQAAWASGESAFHVVGSRYVRNTIAHFTGESEKLRIIPIGVDTSVFTRLPEGRSPDPNQIVYVGRNHSIKGVDVLLRAMRRLIGHRPELRLILVGGLLHFRGYRIQEEGMRRLAQELGLGGNVEFVGYKSPHEVAQYMRESALLVLPSRLESFGAVVVEALACGTPVVVTRCGGPEDVVTPELGVLVPTEDEAALADAMDGVLTNRDRYNSAHLRAYARQGFDWEVISRRYVGLYQEAVAPLSPV